MSSYSLSKAEIRLLSKGFKFAPTPISNHPELEKDVNEFCRKLRLKEFFYQDESENSSYEDPSIARNKSTFHPSRNRDRALDTGIDAMQKASKNLQSFALKTAKDNLTHSERRALKTLRQNHNIIIKEADKGGAICIMDKTYYASKIKSLLNDQNTYKFIKDDQISSTINKIKKFTKKYSETLTQKEIDFINNFEIKGSNIYGLPKVHKSKEINEAIQQLKAEYIEIKSPSDLTFRPIVAGPSCPTSRISHIVDILIKPLQEVTKSYIRDDIDFLSKIPRKVNSKHGHTLVTFDVESLYTNIDKTLGIKAVKYWINKYRNLIPSRFSESFIADAIEIILDNNTFAFDDEYFLQVKGTAMGTKFAPSYANLVLAYLEEKMYDDLHSSHNEELSTFIKNNYFRYLDDIFILWDNRYNLSEFNDILNKLHPNFKFKMESNTIEIPFLDIKVKLNNGCITTDIFYKPTDSHQYLNFKSSHPRHTKHNIPFSQAIRLCTIIDDPDIKEIKLNDMKSFFVKCGYPKTLVERGIEKAKSIPQADLRKPKQKSEEDVVAFVSTHNPNNPNLWPTVQNTLSIIKTSDRVNKALKSSKIMS